MNRFTLEFDDSLVPLKYLMEYRYKRKVNACFLLCLFTTMNFIFDLYDVIAALCEQGTSHPRLDYFLTVMLENDGAILIVTVINYCVARRYRRYYFKGVIAVLTFALSVPLVEVMLPHKEFFISLDLFLLLVYVLLSYVSIEGEDNFLIVLLSYICNFTYTCLRQLFTIGYFHFLDYIIPALFFLFAGYGSMRDRKLLLLEKGKLANHSHKWKEVLRTLGDAILIYIRGKIVFHNKALEDILEFKGEEDISVKVDEFFRTHKFGEEIQSSDCDLSMGLDFVCDRIPEGTYSLLSNGNLDYTIYKKSIIFKKSDAILLMIRSFSSVENMQRKVTEDKFRNILLSTISHDIKTPLAAVQSNLLLLQAHVCGEGRVFYDATCAAARFLEFYLHDIIDMKKIFEGSFSLNYSMVSVRELFRKLRTLTELSTSLKDIRLNIQAAVTIEAQIDARRLTQVLLNLVSNAIKYTTVGHIDVIASEKVESSGNYTLYITVSDTGIGIKPEYLHSIFKMFGLVDKKQDMTGTGLGLGLYLCRYMINEMGGKMSVTSQVDEGTTFRIELPVKGRVAEAEEFGTIPNEMTTPDSAQLRRVPQMMIFTEKDSNNVIHYGKHRKQASSQVRIELSPVKKLRVLLVEDEPLVMLAEKQMIKSQGCEVDGVTNGQLAVQAVRQRNAAHATKYDLVMMDINMPVMNGYVASSRIKDMAQRGEIIDVPIVCLSAQDSTGHREKCVSCGIIEFVEKPMDAARLRELLAKYNTNDYS